MLGDIIFKTLWVITWVILICTGLGLITMIADGDHERI